MKPAGARARSGRRCARLEPPGPHFLLDVTTTRDASRVAAFCTVVHLRAGSAVLTRSLCRARESGVHASDPRELGRSDRRRDASQQGPGGTDARRALPPAGPARAHRAAGGGAVTRRGCGGGPSTLPGESRSADLCTRAAVASPGAAEGDAAGPGALRPRTDDRGGRARDAALRPVTHEPHGFVARPEEGDPQGARGADPGAGEGEVRQGKKVPQEPPERRSASRPGAHQGRGVGA